MRGNQSVDNPVDVAAREIMGLQLIDGNAEPRLIRLDERQDDLLRHHAPQPHTDQRENTDVNVRSDRRDPQPQRNKMQKHGNRDNDDNKGKSRTQQ